MYGLAADIRVVRKHRVTPYTKAIGARYPAPPPYYAPLTFVSLRESDEIFIIGDAAVILSDPLLFARYLENWTEVGLTLPALELTPLLTDDNVDAFMAQVDDQGIGALVNPVFRFDDRLHLVSGTRLVSQERFIASRQ